MTMYRIPFIILFLLLSCAACFGQSSYKGLTPGRSTKADVARSLGQPLKEYGETLAEYSSGKETEKIFVKYRRDSAVVERIEAIYPGAAERAPLLRSLGLPARPTASQTNERGRLEEYFAAASAVLTYASADAGGGIIRVIFYTREAFDGELAKVGRNPQSQSGRAADASATERSAPAESTSTGLARPAAPSTGTTTDTEQGRTTSTASRATPSVDSAQGMSVMRVPREVRAVPGGVEMVAPGGDGEERPLSVAELKRFVGTWEFASTTDASLKEAVVALSGGRLTFKVAPSAHTLVHTGRSQVISIGQGPSRSQTEQFNFKLTGRPDAVVRFTVSEGEVRELFFAEEKDGDMTFAVAFRKP